MTKSFKNNYIELAKKIGGPYSLTSKGIKKSTVDSIMRGSIPAANTVLEIAEILEVTVEEFFSGVGGKRKKSKPLQTLSYSTVPVLARLPAGFPDEVNEEVLEYISVPGIEVNAYAIIVQGDSMNPVIKYGDYVFFTITDIVKNGDVIVVKNEYGESMIKRYQVTEKSGEVRLTNDNPEYPSFRPNEDYKIVGKVIKVWRDIKI